MDMMALLLSTNDWDKLPIQQRYADDHGLSVWRTRGRYKKFLEDIAFPLNLYFFHQSIIRYCARCTRIERVSAPGYRLADVPPAFRSDPVDYTLFFTLEEIREMPATHVNRFPKWKRPGEFHDRGQLGLFKVVDIFAR